MLGIKKLETPPRRCLNLVSAIPSSSVANTDSDSRSQAQEAAESWGATCVENWSKATHVVCESETIPKYIGLNLHLVSVSPHHHITSEIRCVLLRLLSLIESGGGGCVANVGDVGARWRPVAVRTILSRSRTRCGRPSLGLEEEGKAEHQHQSEHPNT